MELIDTLWNVNTSLFGISNLITLELIDTLWNVNDIEEETEDYEEMELIDTLWNVNVDGKMYCFTMPSN